MKYKFVKENTTEASSGTLPVITKDSLDSLPANVALGYLDNKIIEPVSGGAETVAIELDAEIRETSEKIYTETELNKMKKAQLVVIAQLVGVEIVPDSETNAEIITKILDKQNGGSN